MTVVPGVLTHDVVLAVAPMQEQVVITQKAPPSENAVESWTDNIHANVGVREIRESAARNAGEALAVLDGLGKIRKGGMANDVLLRGLANDNINVLLDGARVNGACPNHMDPRAFRVDFSEIERVEVTKGAFDIASQGSLGGAINIVTKDPDAGLRFTPNLMAGSFGFYNPSLTASYSAENVWGLAGYSFRVSEPYRDGAGRAFTHYTNYRPGSATTDAFRIHTGWFRLGGAPRPGQRAEVSYTRQESGQALYPYLMMDAGYDNADRLSASWQAPRGGLLSQVRGEGYATRVNHWMTDDLRTSGVGTPSGYSMATFAETLTFGGKLTTQFGAGLTAGVEAYRRRWDGVNTRGAMDVYSAQHMIPDPVSDVVGAYAQYQRAFFRAAACDRRRSPRRRSHAGPGGGRHHRSLLGLQGHSIHLDQRGDALGQRVGRLHPRAARVLPGRRTHGPHSGPRGTLSLVSAHGHGLGGQPEPPPEAQHRNRCRHHLAYEVVPAAPNRVLQLPGRLGDGAKPGAADTARGDGQHDGAIVRQCRRAVVRQ